ncbi:MAG: hypothetical protein BHV77_13635 [Bacteroides sp. 43_108]|nr:MAG: hypothetical protein BHV77_13635 [Bacteroides sp. 43_108]
MPAALMQAYPLPDGNMQVLKGSEGWFVGTGVGAQLYVGDSDGKQDFGYRISAMAEVDAGKWITPTMALRFQAVGARATGGSISGKEDAMNLMHFHVDFLADVLALLAKRDVSSFYTPLPFVGVGFAMTDLKKRNCATLTVGLLNRFNINEHIDLNLELKGTLLSDKMDGFVGGCSGEGTAMLSAGFTYKF